MSLRLSIILRVLDTAGITAATLDALVPLHARA